MKYEFDINDILTPNKFVPLYLKRKDSNISDLPPYSVELHLTSICNYSCTHCSYTKRNRSNACLSEQTINKLLYDLINKNKPHGVYFSGGGEPTTIKCWDKYIDVLVDNGIEVALITNGSLINEVNLSTVSKLNYIAISIYSVSEDLSEKICGKRDAVKSFSIPKMIKNVSNETVVGARCVINKWNFREIDKIYFKAIESGFDYVIFIPAVNYENSNVSLLKPEIETLLNEYKKFKVDDKKTNLSSLLKRGFGSYYFKYAESLFKDMDCQSIRLRTNAFVNYDGGIYLCQPHIGDSSYSIGNINDNQFSDIWNSKRHVEVIDKLSDNWSDGKCANCRSIAFNNATYNHMNSTSTDQIFNIKSDSFI